MNHVKPVVRTETVIVEQCDCGGGRFGYILADGPGGSAYLIDPGPDPGEVLTRLQDGQYLLKGVILTHNQPDCNPGLDELLSEYRVPVLGHLANQRADMHVSDGERCLLGRQYLHFLHTPGHSADSMCVRFGGHLFCGDTLLVGTVGATPSPEMALAQFESLQRLMELDGELLVWPGLDCGPEPHSSIAAERKNNPFIACLGDFGAFMRLKDNRDVR